MLKHTLAIDNVCGWPNLTRLPDGRLVSTVFNQPSHGLTVGEVDCYVSEDGEQWSLLGTPAPHRPGQNWMNVACGLAHNGDYVVLVGGWDRRPERMEDAPPYPECNRLPAIVCRSADGGHTFAAAVDFHYSIPGDEHVLVPYGDIIRLGGHRLAAACYTCSKDMKFTKSYIVFSDDDGFTWTSHGVISGNNYHETALWFHDDDNGIALCRHNAENRLDQFVTSDGGRTWTFDKHVTCNGIHPAHIAGLNDGSLLMTCGVRFKNMWGVAVSVSKDGGGNWSRLAGLCHLGQLTDGGYPSTVQLDNGELITHYYASSLPFHDRYAVGQVRWNFDELF